MLKNAPMFVVGLFTSLVFVKSNNIYISADRKGVILCPPKPKIQIAIHDNSISELPSSNATIKDSTIKTTQPVLSKETGAVYSKRTEKSKPQKIQRQIKKTKTNRPTNKRMFSFYWVYVFAGGIICIVAIYRFCAYVFRPIYYALEDVVDTIQYKSLQPTKNCFTQSVTIEALDLSEIGAEKHKDPDAELQIISLAEDVDDEIQFKMTVADRVKILQDAIDSENLSKSNERKKSIKQKL